MESTLKGFLVGRRNKRIPHTATLLYNNIVGQSLEDFYPFRMYSSQNPSLAFLFLLFFLQTASTKFCALRKTLKEEGAVWPDIMVIAPGYSLGITMLSVHHCMPRVCIHECGMMPYAFPLIMHTSRHRLQVIPLGPYVISPGVPRRSHWSHLVPSCHTSRLQLVARSSPCPSVIRLLP